MLLGKRHALLLLVVCLAFAASHLFAKTEKIGPAPGLEPLKSYQTETPERFVERIYARLERLIQASGADISIHITDASLFSAKQFGTITWGSIAEYPDEGSIAVSPNVKGHADGQESVHYLASWISGDGRWLHLAEPFQNDPRSVAEVLAGAAPEIEGLQYIDTMVTFDVTVRLAGRQMTYGAAMLLWHNSEGLAGLHPVDYVLQAVDLAAAQNPTLLTDQVFVDPRGLEPKLDAALGWDWYQPVTPRQKNSCLPYSTTIQRTKEAKGTNNHNSGFHAVEAKFIHTCSCEANCVSSCDTTKAWEQCIDSGQRAGHFCHKLSFNGQAKGHSSMQGGASCGGATGCAQVTCSTPSCNLCNASVVTVSGGPANFSLGGGSGASWTYLVQSSMSCGQCVEQADGNDNGNSPPQDGGDPSNGGAGNPPSPILINLEGGGFFLTGLDDPVSFDIDADGYAETIGWSTREGDEAFLVLDRNGNGSIDDGSELFGNFTEQPVSPEPNGFFALAVFDNETMGGNVDGSISADDAVFPWLMLWHDRNHDGISDPGELSLLAESNVASISLSTVSSRRRDRHGNWLQLASHVQFNEGPHQRLAAIDVFFVISDDP